MKLLPHGFQRLLFFGLSAAALLLWTGCNVDTRMSTLDTRGPVAEAQYDLFMITVWVTGFIFVAVGGALAWVVFRFREKANDARPLPSQGHGNPLIEIGLIGASVLLLVVIAVPTLRAIWFTHDLPVDPESNLRAWYTGGDLAEEEKDNVLVVNVIGYQWWWAFEYPQLGVTTANEMVIPSGKAIHLNLRSVDVIHSFWLPRIAGKVDLIPGRANSMWIQAGDNFQRWMEKNGIEPNSGMDGGTLRARYADHLKNEIEGYYYGQCAEFCGDSHARMLFRATVVDDAEFAEWIDDMKAGHLAPGDRPWSEWYEDYDNNPEVLTSAVDEGLKLFMSRARCATCHVVDGNPRAVGVAGPSLTNLAQRYSIAAGWMNHLDEATGEIDPEAQYANFFDWIKESDIIKPSNLMWKAGGGGIGEIDPLLSDDEIHKISLYLQTLK